jgi:hypothetical protein
MNHTPIQMINYTTLNFLALIVGLPPQPLHAPSQHFFWVSNFPNLTILLGKEMEKNNANSKKNVMNNFFAKT